MHRFWTASGGSVHKVQLQAKPCERASPRASQPLPAARERARGIKAAHGHAPARCTIAQDGGARCTLRCRFSCRCEADSTGTILCLAAPVGAIHPRARQARQAAQAICDAVWLVQAALRWQAIGAAACASTPLPSGQPPGANRLGRRLQQDWRWLPGVGLGVPRSGRGREPVGLLLPGRLTLRRRHRDDG